MSLSDGLRVSVSDTSRRQRRGPNTPRRAAAYTRAVSAHQDVLLYATLGCAAVTARRQAERVHSAPPPSFFLRLTQKKIVISA